MTAMKNHHKSYLCIAVTILLWSTVASVFRLSLRDADFIQFTFYSVLSSLISLLVISGFSRSLKIILTQSRREILYSALLGFINPFTYYLFLSKAYSLLPAQEAQPLNWVWPIVLTILTALLLKQRLSLRSLSAFAICFFGVLIIATHGNLLSLSFANPFGVILALCSSIFWALYWALNLKDKRPPLVKLTSAFIFGTVYYAVAVLIFSDFNIDFTKTLAGAVYIGLFEMGVSFVLWLKALSLAKSPDKIAVLAYLTPFLSLIVIHFVVGEAILPSSIIGLTLIIAGIVLNSR